MLFIDILEGQVVLECVETAEALLTKECEGQVSSSRREDVAGGYFGVSAFSGLGSKRLSNEFLRPGGV